MPAKKSAHKSKKATSTKSKVASASTPVKTNDQKPRRLKAPRYSSFRLRKKIRSRQKPLSGPISLTRQAFRLMRQHWVIFAWLLIIYAVLSLVLVRGFGSELNVREAKETLAILVEGRLADVTITASVFGIMLSTVGTVSTATASVYQSILLVVTILTTIWTVRTLLAGQPMRARDAYYRGLYPIVVFLLVLMAIGVQLLPLVGGSWLYGIVVSGGIAITFAEKALFLALFAFLGMVSLYMITSSLFALFVSTLPDMTPLKALKSAQQLVQYRRWYVLARVIALVFLLPLMAAAVMMPFILFLPVVAEWLFFVLTCFATIYTVVYLYLLYRELLNE